MPTRVSVDNRIERDLFEEFAHGEREMRSAAVPGFFMRRDWLDPKALPRILDCFREIAS